LKYLESPYNCHVAAYFTFAACNSLSATKYQGSHSKKLSTMTDRIFKNGFKPNEIKITSNKREFGIT